MSELASRDTAALEEVHRQVYVAGVPVELGRAGLEVAAYVRMICFRRTRCSAAETGSQHLGTKTSVQKA